MSRKAERVHTDPEAIARLQDLVAQLPAGARVSLLLNDGVEVTGIVVARPMTQLFFGPDGTEGTNSVLRLQQPAMYNTETGRIDDIWLDRIALVRRLDPMQQPGPVPGH